MKQRIGRILSLLFSAGMLGVLLLAWVNRQNIYDWYRLKDFSPSTQIATLASNTTMDDYGRRIFYVQHPQIDNKSAFNGNCKQDEHTIVLGCYVSGAQRIYLLGVTDKRLAGVEEVTAAHEMLHAAYDRLSASEKDKVTGMINDAYAKITDKRIRETIDQYKKSGADITDELHSILGTEARMLPANLEKYYSKYFTSRLEIVSYSEKYQNEFSSRKAQVDGFDTQLASLKKQIETTQSDLNVKAAQLKSDRDNLDSLISAGDYKAYNSGVNSYNAKVDAYNQVVAQTKSLIAQYNTILAKRNSIALEEQELYKALDSKSLITQRGR